MKKNEVIKMVTDNKGKLNEATGRYEISQNMLERLRDNLYDGLRIQESKKEKNVYRITNETKKTTYLLLEVKEQKTKVKKLSGGNGHKVKLDSYIILFKKNGDEKETRNEEITNCADMKKFLKTLPKKQLEYLKIYDKAMNECRKSAWVVK